MNFVLQRAMNGKARNANAARDDKKAGSRESKEDTDSEESDSEPDAGLETGLRCK